MSGHIFAFVTATRVKWEDEYQDYPNEEHGWVDPRWSLYELYESRNDASPVVHVDEGDRETLEDEVREALDNLPGGFEDNGDGTFYASDVDQPYDGDGWIYSYALHFVRKDRNPRATSVHDSFVETPWHPARDGGISLTD